MKALVKEIKLRSENPDWKNHEFHTLYFGGGTPSVLSPISLKLIADVISDSFRFKASGQNILFSEATIEVNPEDVTKESLRGWKGAGFNRLSIGVQSFCDSQLEWMNRKHSAEEAFAAVKLAHEAGFNRISIDLIYGLPQFDAEWEKTVDIALGLPVDQESTLLLQVQGNYPEKHWIAFAAIDPEWEE